MSNQILYLFDPLCGWCYGFSQTIVDFQKKHQGKYEFVAIPGGMMVDTGVKPIADMEDYIASAIPRVEQMTGSKFGDPFKLHLLRSRTTLLDSEPPSRALITFRTFRYDDAISFAHALQKAHFFHGRDYNDPALYEELASSFGLDPEAFVDRYHDPKMKQQVQQEFAWVRESGIQGYPTVVMRSDQKYFMLSNGFVNESDLENALVRGEKRLT